MKIILKSLTLLNFKGIKSLTVDFNDVLTEIRGANATGKTSIFDAFTWLLFGKDSQGKKDFDIETLDSDGSVIHRIDHSVTAVMLVDGIEKKLTRTYREKWQTEKGKTEEKLKQRETICEIDNVPLKISEYNSRISGWIDESLFKLITSPTAFVSLKTQEQRQILMTMAGLNDDLTLATESGRNEIVAIINSGKSVADRAKELAKTRAKIKKELDLIPARIDEVSRGIIEHRTVEAIGNDIAAIKKAIEKESAEIEKAKSTGGANKVAIAKAEMEQAQAEHRAKVFEVKNNNDEIRLKHKREVDGLKDNISAVERYIREAKRDIEDSKKVIEKKRAEFLELDKSEYPVFNDTCCPCCGRAWDAETLEEKKAEYNRKRVDFMKAKRQKKVAINEDGKKYIEFINEHTAKVAEKKKELDELKTKLKELEEKSLNLKEAPELDLTPYLAKIEAAEQEATSEIVDTSGLDMLREQLSTLENEKMLTNTVEKQKKRIAELEADATAKAQAIADIEKEETTIEEFTRFKVDALDKAVNDKFQLVKFKLYDYQLNGGFTECCEPTINGVPYSSLNSAAKINAGLDIIKTLQQFYGTTAPVFVDGKESINEVFETGSQLICLTVSNDKTLTIINNIKEVA
jgi:DNA repair exonuclease SbcCD ATPase subunit